MGSCTPSLQGSLVSAMPALVGMISGLLWGLAANRFGPARLAAFCAIGSGCAVAAFGFTPPVLSLLMLVSGVMGFFAGGSAGLFYATMATTLPPLIQATGMGWSSASGGCSASSRPLLAGVMFAGGPDPRRRIADLRVRAGGGRLLLLVVNRPRAVALTASVNGALELRLSWGPANWPGELDGLCIESSDHRRRHRRPLGGHRPVSGGTRVRRGQSPSRLAAEASLSVSSRAAEALDELGVYERCYETSRPFSPDSTVASQHDAAGNLLSAGPQRPR